MSPLFLLRILLFPFSVLYGGIVTLRNVLYDVGALKSTSFKIPVICVGNLSVGGTGKTPQIEYLIRLLKDESKVAVLSRGYKRKSKGFVLAGKKSTVADLGDEPFQYHQKFKEIQVAVNGDRVEGVTKILEKKPKTAVVLLDDAYQHRKIKAGFHILLTSYSGLFYKDFMMPTGNLRELWWGKKRADVIIVTKCPSDLTEKEQQTIVAKIAPEKHQQVFFTKVAYAKKVKGTDEFKLGKLKGEKIVLVTGIAKAKPLTDYLTKVGLDFEHLEFPDHHNFTVKELKEIHEKSMKYKILTTEKDYVRLQSEVNNLFYLPIETEFLNKSEVFDASILKYIKA
ncbi:tetraacyldisaccharide 4'-kinase [Wenyingzhuangia sp. IMCC45574]